MLIFEKDPYKIIFKEILRFINIKFIKILKNNCFEFLIIISLQYFLR